MALDKLFIDEAKNRLLADQKRIQNELERFAKETDAPGEYETKFNNIGTDEDENASEVEEYTDNLALEDSLEKQLKEIMTSLEIIEKGTYGICTKCNKEIDIARLKAYPSAKNCISCL